MSSRHKSQGKNYRARTTARGTDFFGTYHALTREFLDNYPLAKYSRMLEPCAGAGDISKIIWDKYPGMEIIELDIEPRREGIIQADFLALDPEDENILPGMRNIKIEPQLIITNPPFTLHDEFLVKCSQFNPATIIFLAPLDYLHGAKRYEMFFENGFNGYHLTELYVLSRRPLFGTKYRRDGKIPTGSTSFAWFVYEFLGEYPKMYHGPLIKWLPCKGIMGTPDHVDQVFFA